MGNLFTKPGRNNIKSWRNKADKVFSKYIRLRNADYNGYVSCYTCGKVDQYKNMDCGHYIPRGYLGTRYDEINCQVQCKYCNCSRGQNREKHILDKFLEHLKQDYGSNVEHELNKKKNKIYKIDIDGYKQIYDNYRDRAMSRKYFKKSLYY